MLPLPIPENDPKTRTPAEEVPFSGRLPSSSVRLKGSESSALPYCRYNDAVRYRGSIVDATVAVMGPKSCLALLPVCSSCHHSSPPPSKGLDCFSTRNGLLQHPCARSKSARRKMHADSASQVAQDWEDCDVTVPPTSGFPHRLGSTRRCCIIDMAAVVESRVDLAIACADGSSHTVRFSCLAR